MVVNQENAWRLGSAMAYGISSLLITIVNKTVLTSYNFPSFQVLGIGQMLATIVILYAAKKLRFIDFPNFESSTFGKIWPLPVIYIGNMIFGLAFRRFASDAFVQDFNQNHVQLSKFQRAVLGAGAAAICLADPYRADMIACLGETTGENALSHCLARMRLSQEGLSILEEKPRINTKSLCLERLAELPEGTLGKTYHNFLLVNKVTPDSRDHVKFVDDVELAYVMQRYREVHDIFHAVLLMPTTMLGEVTVKWVEALQTKLPMCLSGAIFGALRLRPKQRQLYAKHHLPWALKTGTNANFLLGIYFEKRWEQSLVDFHRETNIAPLAT
ncbi:ubiquinone biosynthesis protein COQ4 homolog, mitochondrial-like [Venturia canescens]|uniref:ubiquinone biosynthesis protein COQ4 homolog, mitochondrial-like n=1 Tax=Venturia canescens TaxID=32260 RepID=UPI001C9CBE1C|nr:ubiquinone biosynthesis protein COQ4 homolog, mitochondrial-like [Venturia canescens]